MITLDISLLRLNRVWGIDCIILTSLWDFYSEVFIKKMLSNDSLRFDSIFIYGYYELIDVTF